MKDRHDADARCAKESRVTSELFECSVCAGEHGSIPAALVAADDTLERLWDRDGEQEVVVWQEFLLLLVKPLLGLVVLAGWAVSVAAGAGKRVYGVALIAAVHGRAEGAATTITNRVHDLLVHLRHAIAVVVEVLGTVLGRGRARDH